MRLLMLTDPVLFGDPWANAASTHLDVVRLRVGNSNAESGRAGDLVEEDPGSYRYLTPTDPRPIRRPVDALRRRRALLHAFDRLSERHGPFDACAVHFFVRARPAAVLRSRRGVRTVIIEHSTALTGENPDQMPLSRARSLAARAYRRADLIVFVSEHLRSRALELGVVPATARQCVLPNPVDTRLFRPPPAATPGSLDVVCVARLAPVKQHHLLIDATAILRERGRSARLTLVGSGPEEDSLRRRARHLGVAEEVHFTGQLDRTEIAQRLRNSGVFALTSATENAPFAIIEAMCSGLPVVATEVGGVPALLSDHPSVLLSQPSAVEVADALERAAGLRFDRARAGEQAARRFGYEPIGGALAGALAELLTAAR